MVGSIWHKHHHNPLAAGAEQLPFAVPPNQEIPPHTSFAPRGISQDRNPSHPSGGDTSFRNGPGVPKTTHSPAGGSTWLLTSLPPNAVWVCFLRVWSSGRQSGCFNLLCQHSNLMMTRNLLGHRPAEVTALQKIQAACGF